MISFSNIVSKPYYLNSIYTDSRIQCNQRVNRIQIMFFLYIIFNNSTLFFFLQRILSIDAYSSLPSIVASKKLLTRKIKLQEIIYMDRNRDFCIFLAVQFESISESQSTCTLYMMKISKNKF